VWLIRFIEDCYDEAMTVCCTSNITRNIKTNGLDLGSMDAFPLFINCYLTRTYSIMDVRDHICLELLLTINYYLEKELALDDTTINDIMINSNRITLFSKFLSEEYDIEYLALFLHCRDATQRILKMKFKDLIQSRIWQSSAQLKDEDKHILLSSQLLTSKKSNSNILTMKFSNSSFNELLINEISSEKNISLPYLDHHDDHPSDKKILFQQNKRKKLRHGNNSLILKSNENIIYDDENQSMKILPIKLPPNMKFITDIGCREVPVLCIKQVLLHTVLNAMIPNLSSSNRNYLYDLIMNHTMKQYYEAQKRFVAEKVLAKQIALITSSSKSLSLPSISNKMDALDIIPLDHDNEDIVIVERPIDENNKIQNDGGVYSPSWMNNDSNEPKNSTSNERFLMKSNKLFEVSQEEELLTQNGNRKLATQANTNSNSFHQDDTTDVPCEEIHFIPLYLIFSLLIQQWVKLPAEKRGEIVAGNSNQSLRLLNAIYDRDCAMMKDLEANLIQIRKSITNCDADVISLEKSKRKLERKWNDGIASPDDVKELQEVKRQIAEMRAEKYVI
jgi:hypothetical protein